MKYSLRNKKLEEMMRKLYGADFNKKLQTYCEWQMNNPEDYVIVYELYRVDGYSDEIHFSKSEIDIEKEFNPYQWNPFPDVTPPESIWMQVETDMGFGFKAKYFCGSWIDNRGDCVDELDGPVVRYRTWSRGY